MIHQTTIRKVCDLNIPDPQYGDLKLSVMPFENNGKYIKLPIGFELWEKSLNEIISQIPLYKGANTHYITIDSRFFTKSDFLRREGIHADGNFCVDPNFIKATWGGSTVKTTWGGIKLEPQPTWGGVTIQPTWGGAMYSPKYKVIKDWVLPYDIEIPLGNYISEKKGGIFAVSTEIGCQGWDGEFYGEVGAEGDFSEMRDQVTDDKKVIFEKDILYFMTSNTPHETLLIEKGKRRTFIRITLNHNYPNNILPCMKEKEFAIK
jgi:hypothetical protein